MTLVQDNISPYLTFVEGSAPSSPAATDFKLFFDSSDHLLKWKNSAGTVTAIATGSAVVDQGTVTYLDFTTAAAPSSPAAGKIRVYSKTSDTLAQKTSGGTETVFGAGGGGGGTAWVSSERAYVDPTTQTWAWLNQGSATITANGASLALYDPANASDSWRMRTKAVPSKPYSLIVHMRGLIQPYNYPGFAVGWVESSSGHFAGFGQYSAAGTINWNSFKSGTNYSITANYVNTSGNLLWVPWVKLTDDSSNRKVFISTDGFNWILFHTVATNDFLTPDKLMFGLESRNSSSVDAAMTLDSWEEGV